MVICSQARRNWQKVGGKVQRLESEKSGSIISPRASKIVDNIYALCLCKRLESQVKDYYFIIRPSIKQLLRYSLNYMETYRSLG
jgi:hypothetical protein